MARSYASVARSGLPSAPPTDKRSVLRVDAPAWTPPPRCHTCGSAADVCPECVRTCAYYPGWGLQPVVKDGLCSQHAVYHESKAHAFFNVDLAQYIPQTCTACRAAKPWKPSDCLQIRGFSYERACLCHPLKSPNGGPFNVVYVPIFTRTAVGLPRPGRAEVELWAEAAYKKEMEFSGDSERAQTLKDAILGDDPLVHVHLH